MESKVLSFSKATALSLDPKGFCEIELPKGAKAEDYRLIQIRDNAFIGDLRYGTFVLVHLGEIRLPTFHAVLTDRGQTVIRKLVQYAETCILVASSPNFPPIHCSKDRVIGRVVRIYLDIATGEYWELHRANNVTFPKLSSKSRP